MWSTKLTVMPTDDDPREELKVRILRLIDNTEGISLYQILEKLGIRSDGGIRCGG